MDTKRLILAVVLSSAVLLVFNYFAPKRAPTVPAGTTAQGLPAAAPVAALPASVAAAPLPGPAAIPPKSAFLENDRVRIELSSRGGAVVRSSLKDYRDRPGRAGAPMQVVGTGAGDAVADTRLASGALGFGASFQELEAGAGRVVYAWDSPAGLRVEKTYTLAPGRYDLTATFAVRNRTAAAVRDQLGVLLVRDYTGSEDKYAFTGPSFMSGGELKEVKLGDVKKEAKQVTGEIAWAALMQKYFLAAVVPVGAAGSVRIDRHRGQEKVMEVEVSSAPFDLPPGGEKALAYHVYLGPKLAEALSPVGSQLERAIDYGWFSVIARPLLAFLKLLYRGTGNYGLAIIVLTTLVKGAFWPLSAKSFKSMQKMKDLQPKMQKLKERYAKDRERLNAEVMQLYKTHKVNPLGGCLPMLVQIPVFFALYRVLGSAIELRHAPFLLWITDLSVKDPFYVTPLIMGVSMFLQQKMTPATGVDEMQAKMMQYGMPVVFTFMFLNFASGLVLYWLVNNLLSIIQQGLMIRSAKAEAS